MKNRFLFTVVFLCLFGVLYEVGAQEIDLKSTIVEENKSKYCIFYSKNAADSVKLAAKELKEYFNKTSGVNLPVIVDSKIPGCNVISLGNNSASRKYLNSIDDIPLEGYRIKIQKNRIFIIGHDTYNNKVTPQGGTSSGTLNGVYSFIEKYLGVRWLLPGEIGEYIPKINHLKINQTDFIDKPYFLNRRIPYIQNNNPQVKEWLRRQKQGYSLELKHGHSFTTTIPSKEFNEHPEWFPMIKGRRIPPVGRYKLETTNRLLVDEFSRKIIRQFDENKYMFSRSISPSDSGNWSESPESLKFYEKDPMGEVSVTPLVLDFYNNVSNKVSIKYPDKWLCGYIYSDYLFPPKDGIKSIADNLCLVIAPDLSYGYGLYRDQSKKEWNKIISTWSQSTNKIAYYDLPVMFQTDIGAPNPPGLEILAYIYPELKKHNIKGVYMYGVNAWGHGGLTNYLLAKLNWNPDLDVYKEAELYLKFSYGEEAGLYMYNLYMMLDKATKKYHSKHKLARHMLNKKILRNLYLPILNDMVGLYEKAYKSISSDSERKRLDAFGANLYLFYDYLVKIDLLDKNNSLLLYKSFSNLNILRNNIDGKFLFAPRKKISNKKSAVFKNYKVKSFNGDVRKNHELETPLLRGSSQLILTAKDSGEVVVEMDLKRSFGELVQYSLISADGTVLISGDLSDTAKGIIKYKAVKGRIYYLNLISNLAAYKVNVKNSEFSLNGQVQSRGLHVFKDDTPLYVYAKGGVDELVVTISADGPGESVALEIISPKGVKHAELDTLGMRSVKKSILINSDDHGFWLMKWKKSKVGRLDDAWIQIGSPLVPNFYVNKSQMIIEKK